MAADPIKKIPPPPAGFELEQAPPPPKGFVMEDSTQAIPPPPEGFEVEAPTFGEALGQQINRPSIFSAASEFIFREPAGQVAKGLDRTFQGVFDLPYRAIVSALPDREGEEETFNEALARGREFSETAPGEALAEAAASDPFTANLPSAGLSGATVEQTFPGITKEQAAQVVDLASAIALDPLTYVGLGLGKKAANLIQKGRRAGKTAEEIIETLPAAERAAVKEAQAAKGISNKELPITRQIAEAPENAPVSGAVDETAKPPAPEGQAVPDAAGGSQNVPEGGTVVKKPLEPVENPVPTGQRHDNVPGVDHDKVGRSKLKQYEPETQELINYMRQKFPDEIAEQRRGTVPQEVTIAKAKKIKEQVRDRLNKGVQPGTVFNAEESAASAMIVQEEATNMILDLLENRLPAKAVQVEGIKSEIGRALNILAKNPTDPQTAQKVRDLVDMLKRGDVEGIRAQAVKEIPKNYGKNNKLVTLDRKAKIDAQLRDELSNLTANAPLNPKVLRLMTEKAVFHIEAGTRAFGDFSRIMIAELGDKVRPYLKEAYLRAQRRKGLDATGLDSAEQIDEFQRLTDLNLAFNRTGQKQIPQEVIDEAVNLLQSVGIDRTITDPTVAEKFVEWATAIKLTGLSTQTKAFVGNSAELILRIPEKIASGVVDRARSAIMGTDRTVRSREAAAEMVGIFNSGQRAWKRAVEVLKDPNKAFQEATKAAEVVNRGSIGRGGRVGEGLDKLFRQASGGRVGFNAGEVVRSPFRLIGAMDVFFKELNRGAEIYAQVTREALKNGRTGADLMKDVAKASEEILSNTDDFRKLIEIADEKALVRVFQEPLEGFAATINTFRRKHPLARLIVPFYNTPVNLFKRVLDRTPGLAFAVPSRWRKFFGGKASVGVRSPEFAEFIAQQMVGGAIGTAVYMYGASGGISGRGPKSQARKNTLRQTGWAPFSVKVPDTNIWLDYRGFEPLSSWFRTAGDIAEGVKDKDSYSEIGERFMDSYLSQFAENPFLTGVSDFVDLFQGGVESGKGARFFASLAVGSTIPVILQQWGTRVYDPVVRREKGFVGQVKSRVPVLSKSTKPLRDIFGEEIRRDNPVLQAFGFTINVENESALSKELRSLRDSEGKPISIGKPGKTIAGVDLTDEEYERLTILTGAMYKETLTKLVNSPGYKQMGPDDRAATMRKTIEDVRDVIRHQEFGKYYKTSKRNRRGRGGRSTGRKGR